MAEANAIFTKHALNLAERAVHFENEKNYEKAVEFYAQASKCLDVLVEKETNNERRDIFLAKRDEYAKKVLGLGTKRTAMPTSKISKTTLDVS